MKFRSTRTTWLFNAILRTSPIINEGVLYFSPIQDQLHRTISLSVGSYLVIHAKRYRWIARTGSCNDGMKRAAFSPSIHPMDTWDPSPVVLVGDVGSGDGPRVSTG